MYVNDKPCMLHVKTAYRMSHWCRKAVKVVVLIGFLVYKVAKVLGRKGHNDLNCLWHIVDHRWFDSWNYKFCAESQANLEIASSLRHNCMKLWLKREDKHNKGPSTYGVRWFWFILDLPTLKSDVRYQNQSHVCVH